MTRPPSRPVLAAVAAGLLAVFITGLLPGPLGVPAPALAAQPVRPATSAVPARDTAATQLDPLRVTIHRLTPSVVPTHGNVTVSGQIRNRSGVTWTDLGVYLVTSAEPLTTTAELQAAVASDPFTQVGSRIVDPGLYVHVPDLAPRQSTHFVLSVPRDHLGISGAPGVYWLGVHVLGASPQGSDDVADGRARTFLPLVPKSNPGTRLALGLQLRSHVIREADGQLAHPDQWTSLISGSGRLKRLLDLSATSAFPLTWVVDPAVLEAVRSVAAGNPPLKLGPPAGGDQKSGDGTSGGAGGASPGTSAAPADPGTSRALAAAWLAEFGAGTATHPVLGLPYGDLDVSAAANNDLPDLITKALALSRQAFADASVDSSPVVAPPDGYLAPKAFVELPPTVGVVVGSGALERPAGSPVLARSGGGQVLTAPTNQDVEGAYPGDVHSALAVRQRLLADAALHALSASRGQPLVRLLPAGWDPGRLWRKAQFLSGLDVPWLTGMRISDVLNGPVPARRTVGQGSVSYPQDVAQHELPAATLAASSSLIESSRTLSEALGQSTSGASAGGASSGASTSTVGQAIERQALEVSSVESRFFPGIAAGRARAAQAQVAAWLDRISVRGPSFVVVSSETGTFQVTLVNGLDQPVTIGLRPTVVGGGLRVSAPSPVQLPARGRGAMRIQVTARGIGVHSVTLQPVTTSGTALGRPETLSVRSSSVGAILWVVMAVGAVLLFGAIAFRIWRRIRQRRRTHGPLLKRGAT